VYKQTKQQANQTTACEFMEPRMAGMELKRAHHRGHKTSGLAVKCTHYRHSVK